MMNIMTRTLLGATLSGTFWLTDNPTRTFTGELTIDENGSGKLNIQGDAHSLLALDRGANFHIHGKVEGKDITLFDCFPTWIKHAQKNADIAVNLIVLGALIDALDAKIIGALSFAAPEITDWTGLRGLSRRSANKSRITVKYRPKKLNQFALEAQRSNFSRDSNYLVRALGQGHT